MLFITTVRHIVNFKIQLNSITKIEIVRGIILVNINIMFLYVYKLPNLLYTSNIHCTHSFHNTN